MCFLPLPPLGNQPLTGRSTLPSLADHPLTGGSSSSFAAPPSSSEWTIAWEGGARKPTLLPVSGRLPRGVTAGEPSVAAEHQCCRLNQAELPKHGSCPSLAKRFMQLVHRRCLRQSVQSSELVTFSDNCKTANCSLGSHIADL